MIQYWHPAYCVGHYSGRRVAQVWQTHPGRTIPLELDNGDTLDGEVRVRRIYELSVNAKTKKQPQLIPHPGIARPIHTYLMTEAVLFQGNQHHNDGLQRQVEKLRQIITQAHQDIHNNDTANEIDENGTATSDEASSLASPKKYPARRPKSTLDRTSASDAVATVVNTSRSQKQELRSDPRRNKDRHNPHGARKIPPSRTIPKTVETDSDEDDDDLPPSVFGSKYKSSTKISPSTAMRSTTKTTTAAAPVSAQESTTGGMRSSKTTTAVTVGTPGNLHDESDDELPPSVLNLGRRRRQTQHPPPLHQLQETRPQKSEKSSKSQATSSSDDDDAFGSQRRQNSASFSGRKRVGLGFDTVQPQKKRHKHLGPCRAMKSFFDGSRDDGGGRPPRPPNNDNSNHPHSNEALLLHNDKALKQQQRDEFAMLLQTSTNHKQDSTASANHQHKKVPRHRRTPTLFRPTVAEDAHSSCHASSDETSNEELPWVPKKKCTTSRSRHESQLSDNNMDLSDNNISQKTKTTHFNSATAIRSSCPNAVRHGPKLEDARGYSSISSVDDDEALPLGGSAFRRRSQASAVLQLESRNRRRKEVS